MNANHLKAIAESILSAGTETGKVLVEADTLEQLRIALDDDTPSEEFALLEDIYNSREVGSNSLIGRKLEAIVNNIELEDEDDWS